MRLRGRRRRRSTLKLLKASDSPLNLPPLEELDLPVAEEYLAFGGEASVNLLLLLQSFQLLFLCFSHLRWQVLLQQFPNLRESEMNIIRVRVRV